jgi:hypothetical protein
VKPSISREVKAVALALCNGLSGRLAPVIASCITDERWDDFLSIEVSPHDYDTAEGYFSDVACISFLRKYEPLPTKIDKKQVAIDGFFEAELACYRTNQRLLPFIYNTYGKEDEAMLEFIQVVRKEVIAIIGEKPPSNPAGRFGPGSTYGDRGSLTTIPDKMTSSPTFTGDAWPFLFSWSGTLWGKAVASRSGSPLKVRGNRFVTVPKDCTKNRGICIGPSINLFYQLGFGSALRERLKLSGIDLNLAQEKHRQVACASSISGDYATIDLRQASDTIAKVLVKLLLPRLWHEPLFDLREPITEIVVAGKKRDVVLEKFSAMGNGYTFELETVIFLAVCRAIYTVRGHKPQNGDNVHVFGDDIIVKTELAEDVIAALRYFGLETNTKKTFVKGPFRESCGGDYFGGVDVRPFFLKDSPSEPQHYIAMANGLRRLVLTNDFSWGRGPHIHRAWFRALDAIPSSIRRFRGPKDLGDLVIHDEVEFWQTRTRRSVRYIRVYRPSKYRKVSWDHFDSDVTLAGACYGVPWGGGELIPRDSVAGYKAGWVPFS